MNYGNNYSDQSFWEKARELARKLGYEAILVLLTLYFTMKDPMTPTWAKAVIVAALGYFLFPLDAIPDMIPVVGYADDVTVVGSALATIAVHVTPEARRRAKEVADIWFNTGSEMA